MAHRFAAAFYDALASAGNNATQRQHVALEFRDFCLALRELAEDTTARLSAQINHVIPVESGRNVPKWSEAKLLLNATMMIRHYERVVDGKNAVLSIGERPSSMKNVTPTSPFLRRDFQALSEYLLTPETPRNEQAKLAALAVLPRGIPISDFNLDHDKFGVLQPTLQSSRDLPRGSKRVHDLVDENDDIIQEDAN
ncbi:hypothetical protein LTR95_010458 [Oleoguttula sp. CCFEE 5521]